MDGSYKYKNILIMPNQWICSVFIHKQFPFHMLNHPVIPLWDAPQDNEDIHNRIRICGHLSNNAQLIKLFRESNLTIKMPLRNKSLTQNYNICFGGMCIIKLDFLDMINNKYSLGNLVNAIRCRADRCALERILGGIFACEFKGLHKHSSIFGQILKSNNAFAYNFAQYMADFLHKGKVSGIVKVWTGR